MTVEDVEGYMQNEGEPLPTSKPPTLPKGPRKGSSPAPVLDEAATNDADLVTRAELSDVRMEILGLDRSLSDVDVWEATAARVIAERDEARAIADALGNALDGCDSTSFIDPGVRRLYKRRRAKAMKAWRYASWYR